MTNIRRRTGDQAEIQTVEKKLISRGYRHVFGKDDMELGDMEYIKNEHQGYEESFTGKISSSIVWFE